MSELNPKTLVSVHCYQGDRAQVDLLISFYEHHRCPVVIVSPDNSPVIGIGGHWCITAGEVGYTGMHTIRRQALQLEALLNLPGNFEWFCCHDSDSICLSPKFPDYLYADRESIYSNVVKDFRVPGTFSHGVHWPLDYHAAFAHKVASQPPYWAHRRVMEKVAAQLHNVQDDPITPFIDWGMAAAPQLAGVPMKRFHACVSINTKTPEEISAMAFAVQHRGATFLHAVKTPQAVRAIRAAYAARLSTHPHER